MKLYKLSFLLIFFFLCLNTGAQIKKVSGGFTAGLGEIQGNSPSVASLGISVYLDLVPWFSDEITFRTGFTYAQKIEYFLPENRQQRYYPFIKSYYLRGMLRVNLNQKIYLEQGAGLIYLNDRTFGDINEWEAGASFNVLAGIDFSNYDSDGIKLGLGLEYGITFIKTNASYYLIYLQFQKAIL